MSLRRLAAWPLLACCLAAAPAWGAEPWRELLPGLEYTTQSAETSARAGSSRIACLRIDPKRYRFEVLVAAVGLKGFTAGQWRGHTGALAVFNAGQFAPDLTYLGLLVQGGRLRGRLVARLEAMFVAEPDDPSLPQARVIDLRYTAFFPGVSPYREAAQSLMLLDRFGQIRVRRSPRVAHRTVVAEDSRGRILVMVTEGGHTLWELAQFLARSELALREVMCMDGGPQSQIDIHTPGFSYSHYGDPTDSPDLPLPWPRAPLPAAVAVFARRAPGGAQPAR